jgi:hypothetical protein
MNDEFFEEVELEVDDEDCPCCRMMQEELGMMNEAPIETLRSAGRTFPEPDSLTEAELSTHLWDLITELSRLRIFLEFTDHLNDRELYAFVWKQASSPMFFTPDDPYSATHVSPIGGCSEEDNEVWLRYYADEDDRLLWSRDLPEMTIPPHSDPPHRREELLPDPMDVFETLH